MKDLLEGLKHLIIRIVSIQNLTCLAKSNNITYDMGSQNIKEDITNLSNCNEWNPCFYLHLFFSYTICVRPEAGYDCVEWQVAYSLQVMLTKN